MRSRFNRIICGGRKKTGGLPLNGELLTQVLNNRGWNQSDTVMPVGQKQKILIL
jgi:hypothetical protein